MKSFKHIHPELIQGFIAAQARKFKGKTIAQIKSEIENYDASKKRNWIVNIICAIICFGMLGGAIYVVCNEDNSTLMSKTASELDSMRAMLTAGFGFVIWLGIAMGNDHTWTGDRLLTDYHQLNEILQQHRLPQLDNPYKTVKDGIEAELRKMADQVKSLDHGTGSDALRKAEIKETSRVLYDGSAAFSLVAGDASYYYKTKQ